MSVFKMSQQSFIISGPKYKSDILNNTSIGKYIFENLKSQDPHKILVIDAISKEVLTVEGLLTDSVKFTNIYKSFGIQRNDVIGIISENTVNYSVPILAALYMGIIANSINPSYTIGELKHVFSISKPKLVICSRNALENVLKVKNEFEFLKTIIVINVPAEETKESSGVENYERLLEITKNIDNFTPEDIDDWTEQGAFIFLSSGTTGLPKGVLITHENTSYPLIQFQHPKYGHMSSTDVTVLVLPYFHIFGLMLQLSAIVAGMKVVLLNKFIPDLYLKCIQDYKASQLYLAPPLVIFFSKSPLVDNYDLSSLRTLTFGAGPVSQETIEDAKNRLENVNIQATYGITETTGAVSYQTIDSDSPGSVGTLVHNIICKSWDPVSKKNLGPLEIGELCFKGPMMMKGYYKNERATKESIDDDGFYHTGDIGYYDQNGFIYVKGRIKEIIRYKGFQVPPQELEALILTNPSVKDCGVVGIPDERAGEKPLAFVVLKNDCVVSEKDIQKYVEDRISVQKRLYGGVRFIDEIPRNPSGKILRRKLVELFESL